VNLHGPVRVPETAGVGKAVVTVSLDGWKEGSVALSQDELEVVAPRRFLKLEPVSARLRQTLIHPSTTQPLGHVQFSPDGRRIMAGPFSGGVLQVWDASTGKEIVSIDAGHQRIYPCFALSPDWSTIYVARQDWTITRLRRDGKRLASYAYDDEVRAYDLFTGELRRTYKHSPPRGIQSVILSPDGRTLLTSERPSGEHEWPGPRPVTLWDRVFRRNMRAACAHVSNLV
jgi:hypothetical protein